MGDLEFFRLISRIYSQSAHAEPASQATPTLAVLATRAADYFPRPCLHRPLSTRQHVLDVASWHGDFRSFDLQFDVDSDTEYDSYFTDTSADIFA